MEKTGPLALLILLLSGPLFPQIQNQPDDGQWVMAAKNYASTRFSTLGQINTSNVKDLKLAWTFSTGVTRGHEAAPLVVNNTMYIVTPWPNYLYALDLTKPGAPMKWVYQPNPSPASQGVACCDVVNRGAAFYDGKIYYNTLDAQTVAVDANTGKEIWKTKLGDINLGESMTMAPIVVKGKVLVGNSGGEFGVRGWLTAVDTDTGQIAWRAFSTGPDREVLIGPNFKPFYTADRAKDLGMKTWSGDAWKIGGGTGWTWISYDQDLDLIYYGTSNPGPWNPEQRPGDNKWTSSLFARRPETGEAIWAYQMNPHDQHDYAGRQGLATFRLFAQDRLDLHPPQQPVLRNARRAGELHCWYAFCRHGRSDVRRSWRESRRVFRVGPDKSKSGLEHQRDVSCLERGASNSRRPSVLRNHGGLVQGS